MVKERDLCSPCATKRQTKVITVRSEIVMYVVYIKSGGGACLNVRIKHKSNDRLHQNLKGKRLNFPLEIMPLLYAV